MSDRKYTVRTVHIPTEGSTEGAPIRALVFMPTEDPSGIGALWIHGGGYIGGMPEMAYASRARDLVKTFGMTILAPDYRLAGQEPYPAALEDCYAALRYLHDHAEELGVDPDRIIVGGESAGGGLTAALCIYARDKGEIPIRYQLPLYPMLDCEDTISSRDNHGINWDTERNHKAWKAYLKNVPGPVPPYASPARLEDYRGLPPAYTYVGDGEPFYDETLTFIRKLQEAGVPAAVDVYPTKVHAFDIMMPMRPMSQKARKTFHAQLTIDLERYVNRRDILS
ncbi:MAG: alpha/beta hydrolase [Firmicutes bacterium]|nr:alpha/beta hydrolase [Bacillota bacterium]